jgi:hypothetical protein
MDIEPKDITPAPHRVTGTQAAEAARIAAPVESEERTKLIAELETVVKEKGQDAYAEKWKALTAEQRKMVGKVEHERLWAMGATHD